MARLLITGEGRLQLGPISGRSEPIQVQERAAVQDRSRGAHDSAESQKGLVVHLVPAQQIRVVAEIPQEPAEFPQGFGGAVEPTGEGMTLVFPRLKNREAHDVERSLRM